MRVTTTLIYQAPILGTVALTGSGRWDAAVQLTAADVCIAPSATDPVTLEILVAGVVQKTVTLPAAAATAELVLTAPLALAVPANSVVTARATCAAAADKSPAQLAVTLRGATT